MEIAKFIANRLPKMVCYWVIVRVASYIDTHCCFPATSMSNITMLDAFKAFNKK